MPRFPFRTDVGVNLRALFAHDRLAAGARNLGRSSITQGEGALDLIEPDGTLVARLGDNGAGFGVYVPGDDGVFRTVQRDAQNRADWAKSYADAAQATATAAQTTANAAQSSVNVAHTRIDNAFTFANGIDAGLAALRGEVEAARGTHPNLAANLAAMSSRIDGLEDEVNTVKALALQMEAWLKKYTHYPSMVPPPP